VVILIHSKPKELHENGMFGGWLMELLDAPLVIGILGFD